MTAITPKHFRSIERRRKAGTFGRKSWLRKEKQELAAGRKIAASVTSGLKAFVDSIMRRFDSIMRRYSGPNSQLHPRKTPQG